MMLLADTDCTQQSGLMWTAKIPSYLETPLHAARSMPAFPPHVEKPRAGS